MAKPRCESPDGGVAHVYARGNDRCLIFRDDADRANYLAMLGEVLERTGARCLAYCLMGNHVHLVIETREGNLGRTMQLLHGRYAQWFNRRHKRGGHLFQGRYGSTVIDDDGHMCMTLRYVDLNPVQAGLCARPEQWPWSSCGAMLKKLPRPKWLDANRALEFLEWLGGDPAKRYAELIAGQPPQPQPQPPQPQSQAQAQPSNPQPSGPPAALDEAARQRDGRELVGGESGEAPRVDLGDQRGKLIALGGRQVPSPPAPQPHELNQPPPLRAVQLPEVLAREDRDLRDREQLEDGKPP